MMSDRSLRELGLSNLEKLWGYLMGSVEKSETLQLKSRWRSNNHKLEFRKFHFFIIIFYYFLFFLLWEWSNTATVRGCGIGPVLSKGLDENPPEVTFSPGSSLQLYQCESHHIQPCHTGVMMFI